MPVRHLNVVFLGYGRMGRASYSAIQQLTGHFAVNNVKVKLIGVLEADKKCLTEMPKYIEAKPVYVDTKPSRRKPLYEILRDDLKLKPSDTFIAYDATPTHVHVANLWSIANNFPNAIYLGEKPLFNDPAELKGFDGLLVGRNRIYCDFIENKSEVMLTLLDLVQRGLRIERLQFWRLNSIGISKLFSPLERKGVTGGSLLDKCTHDLAVTALLLQASGYQLDQAVVESGMAFSFLPFSLDPNRRNAFSSTTSKPCIRILPIMGLKGGSSWAADSSGYAKVQWTRKPLVEAEYWFSWVGVDGLERISRSFNLNSLRETLGGFGLTESGWLRRETHSAGLFLRYEAQDARICILHGTQDGKPVQYAVNFLDGRTSGGATQPFVYDCTNGAFVEIKPYLHRENSLCRVFDSVMKFALDGDEGETAGLNQQIIHAVHKVTFDIRARMFADFSGSTESDRREWERAMEVVGRQLSCSYGDTRT